VEIVFIHKPSESGGAASAPPSDDGGGGGGEGAAAKEAAPEEVAAPQAGAEEAPPRPADASPRTPSAQGVVGWISAASKDSGVHESGFSKRGFSNLCIENKQNC